MTNVPGHKIVEVYTNGNDRSQKLLQRILRIPFRNCLVVVRDAMRGPELRVDGETIPDEDTAAISLVLGGASGRW